jgi:hypothetical protein
LISILTSNEVLAYADYSQPFIIHTDASGSGLGAILLQVQDGRERPISYASRSLTDSERNYPAHKLEFLALKWAVVDKFHDYLYGSKFEVRTDNNPLTYILTTARLDAVGHRWLAALSAYDFTLSYKPGKLNVDADALSRLPQSAVNSEPTSAVTLDRFTVDQICSHAQEQTPIVLQCLMGSVDDGDTSVIEEPLTGTLGALSLPPKDVQRLQEDDHVISVVMQFVRDQARPTQRQMRMMPRAEQQLLRQWPKLCIENNILYRQRQLDGTVSKQLVLPHACKGSVLKSLHDDMAHLGRDRTLDLVRHRFFWPGMSADVVSYISTCDRCLRRKATNQDRAPLISIETIHPL